MPLVKFNSKHGRWGPGDMAIIHPSAVKDLDCEVIMTGSHSLLARRMKLEKATQIREARKSKKSKKSNSK